MAWLTAHQIYFDELYHAEDKTEIPETIALAVDDHPLHAQAYCELGSRVFLMNQPWNQSVSHPLMTRVDGWDALLQALHVGPISEGIIGQKEYSALRPLLQSMVEGFIPVINSGSLLILLHPVLRLCFFSCSNLQSCLFGIR